MPVCLLASLSTCQFVYLPFFLLTILSVYHFVNSLVILLNHYLIKLTFHLLTNSLTWHFGNLPFVNLPLCQIVMSTCHYVKLSCQLAILSTYHFINLPSCQLDISSTYHLINLPFYQIVILSTFHLNLPLYQLSTKTICHFISLSFHHIAILSNYYFHLITISSNYFSTNFPFCQLAILPTSHFVNLPFYQLTYHLVNLTFH